MQVGVANPNEELRPGMYVTLRMKRRLQKSIPEAVCPNLPMRVQCNPWITSQQVSECDICGMDLEPTHSDVMTSESMSGTEGKWACPMHPEEQSDEFGECSICGMDLVEKAETSAEAASVWACPMHPEEQSDEFGECSICGMDLVEKQSTAAGTGTHFHAHQPTVRTDQPPLIFKYVSPDHPDEYATVPGAMST